jgi:vacuolar-type H+-ATPase catalytic subunit A/Vma1
MFNQKKKEEEEEEEISVYEKARLAEQQRQLEDQKRQLQIAQARRQQVLRQEYYEELQRYEEEIEREEHLLNGINKWREERAWNMKYELWYYPDRISWIPRPSLPTVEAEAERQNKERKSMIEMDKALLRAVQNSMSDSEYNRYRKRLKAPEGIGRELGLDGLGLRQEELPPPREPLDD